jgi:RNA polymerase sigma factor (sigma-70 family)
VPAIRYRVPTARMCAASTRPWPNWSSVVAGRRRRERSPSISGSITKRCTAGANGLRTRARFRSRASRTAASLADQIGDDGGEAIHGALELSERRGAIQAALDSLPARERLVVARSYFEERPLREIAEELGVTESRVCQLRAQALARLRKVPMLEFANE